MQRRYIVLLAWPLASCRHVNASELGKLVNYVHAFTKVHGVHDNLFRAVAQTILDATELGILVLWPGKCTVCGLLQPVIEARATAVGLR